MSKIFFHTLIMVLFAFTAIILATDPESHSAINFVWFGALVLASEYVFSREL